MGVSLVFLFILFVVVGVVVIDAFIVAAVGVAYKVFHQIDTYGVTQPILFLIYLFCIKMI